MDRDDMENLDEATGRGSRTGLRKGSKGVLEGCVGGFGAV